MRRSLLALLCASASFAWTPPAGGLRPTNVGDLLTASRGTRYYNEMWSYQLQFDNGLQATLNFTTAKLGFKDPVCGADLSLAGFKGRSYTVGREYPAERFQQSASPFRIQVNENIWMTGLPPHAHHVHFAAAKAEGFFVDLEFSGMKPGVVWGDGKFKAGDGDFSVALPIPMATVVGRIAVGNDTIRVKGIAVLEHLRQSHLVSDLMTSSMRAITTGPSLSYMNLFREKKGGWGGWGVDWSSGQPVLVFASATADGQAPAGAAVVAGANGARLSFERKTLAQSSSILDGMEGATRWIVKKFVGNVRMYRGHGAVNGHPAIYQYMNITD